MNFTEYFALIYLVYAILIIRFYKGLLASLTYIDKLDNTNINELYRPFARLDKNNWSTVEIYLCAVFLLPLRILSLAVLLIPCYLVLTLGSFGLPLKQEWPSKRYEIVRKLVNFLASWYMVGSGFWSIKIHKVQYSDFDPEYVQTKEDRNDKPAIIVSNHMSWYDTIFYVSQYMPSFLSKANVADYPVFGGITTALKSVYVNRDDREGKDQVINQLKERQTFIKEGKVFPPIIIFPEGTTTNGKYLISFKKGAFEALVPVKIACLKYHDRRFNLSVDKIGIGGQIFQLFQAVSMISLVQLYNKLEFYEFEGLYNPKFLNLAQYPEDQRWVIYAERVKNIMSKCLNIPKSEAGFRHNQEYEKQFFSDRSGKKKN